MRRPGRFVEAAGILLAALVVLGIYAIQARAISAYPYFVPASTLEEAAYTHIAVRNFLDYGFLNSGFLQDVASSPHAEDHPFIYNHMPPGHEIGLALVSRLFHRDYAAVHFAQFALVPVGFVFYFLFLRRLLSEIHVVGAGFVVFFISLWQLLVNTSHPHTGPFLLLAFAPLVLAARFSDTRRVPYLVVSLALVFIASWTLDYVVLSAVLATWILLWLTRLWPLRGSDVALAVGVVAGGIILHLLNNAIVLGPQLFFKELAYVLGNRVLGIPSSNALVSFYQEAGILHHGSRPLELSTWARAIRSNFSYPGSDFVVLSVVFGLSLFIGVHRTRRSTRIRMASEGTRAFSFFGRLAVWIAGAVMAPIVLFPAFAQDMTLRGLVHTYFLAIPLLAAVLWVGQLMWRGMLPIAQISALIRGRTAEAGLGRGDHVVRNSVLLVMSASIATLGLIGILRSQLSEINMISTLYSPKNVVTSFRYLEEIRRFNDGFFMTNINTPLIGFMTNQPGFGVCGLASVGESGGLAPRHCRIAPLRQYARYVDQRPRYFFFFVLGVHFPGFATCQPYETMTDSTTGLTGAECHDEQRKRLDRQFRLVLDNPSVRIYDLAAPARHT